MLLKDLEWKFRPDSARLLRTAQIVVRLLQINVSERLDGSYLVHPVIWQDRWVAHPNCLKWTRLDGLEAQCVVNALLEEAHAAQGS